MQHCSTTQLGSQSRQIRDGERGLQRSGDSGPALRVQALLPGV